MIPLRYPRTDCIGVATSPSALYLLSQGTSFRGLSPPLGVSIDPIRLYCWEVCTVGGEPFQTIHLDGSLPNHHGPLLLFEIEKIACAIQEANFCRS